MRNLLNVRVVAACGLTLLLGTILLTSTHKAEARPNYLKAFAGKYKGLAAQAKKVKCGVCHFGKSKKNRNDYGKAVAKGTGKKQKKSDIIDKAFTKAESMKNAKGMTFGELIKAGKLPGTPPK